MLVIKMFYISKAEDMTESIGRRSQLHWRETACTQKRKTVRCTCDSCIQWFQKLTAFLYVLDASCIKLVQISRHSSCDRFLTNTVIRLQQLFSL